MAAPHAVGAAALLLQARPAAQPWEVRRRLSQHGSNVHIRSAFIVMKGFIEAIVGDKAMAETMKITTALSWWGAGATDAAVTVQLGMDP